jgi:uncharacterized protein GlcG (DUF336 family)
MYPGHIVIASGLLLMATVLSAEEQPVVTTKALNGHVANDAAVAAYQECTNRGFHVAVAVTDRQGRLLAFIRSPLSGPHTIKVSKRKAFTAATYRASTSSMMERKHLARSPGVLLLGGGLPIQIGGHFYGAIAVSGAPAEKSPGDVDEACAQAGIDAISEVIEFAGG